MVPGGRFREVYYWDSYWTVKGLLLSEMYNTTLVIFSSLIFFLQIYWLTIFTFKGMIENFKYLIDLYGHIPNGNRYL